MPPDDLDIEVVTIDGMELAILSRDLPQPRSDISPAEEDVLACVVKGMSNAKIAKARGTSPRTVANQIASLLRKFKVSSRYELIVAALTR
jgi:DNA-binding CsgD family transcriptional regulator